MMTRKDSASSRAFSNPSRRDFLKAAAFLAGGIGFMGLHGMRPHPSSAAVDTRTFVPPISGLELDGQFVDYLRSAEGGSPLADVIEGPTRPTLGVQKRIGPPKFQDITIQCDPVMPKLLFDWIAAALTMMYVRKNGAIITTDYNRKELRRLQFTNAMITEFGIPACDASSRDAGYLTVKFAPEFASFLAGTGSVLPAVGAKFTAWSPSHFRLTIPGLDCSRVALIDALTVKQAVVPQNIGEVRDFQKQPARLEFPNLVIYVAEAFAGTFYAWFQDMVIKGNAGANFEKPGTLELLDPALRTSLLTIYFNHLGIFRFTPETLNAYGETIRRVKVEMYCKQITLTPVKG